MNEQASEQTNKPNKETRKQTDGQTKEEEWSKISRLEKI